MFPSVGCLLLLALAYKAPNFALAQERAKNNGDIYVVSEQKFIQNRSTMAPAVQFNETHPNENNDNEIGIDEAAAAMEICNASFSIPKDYIDNFNATGELPDVIDKTAMCFIRCFYEKFDLIKNWKLNVEKIRSTMWPATGDSIEYCQQQGIREANACVRTYAIAKCLMLRAIVDARNKPVL